MCRAEDNDPYVTEMATTITDYTVSYTDGIVYDITGTGTGTHKVTNLLDLAGANGYYKVYHNGALVGLSNTDDYTMSGFSDWSFDSTEIVSQQVYDTGTNFKNGFAILAAFYAILAISLVGKSIVGLFRHNQPIDFKLLGKAMLIMIVSAVILLVGIAMINEFMTVI